MREHKRKQRARPGGYEGRKGKEMEYKRTLRESDGIHIIIYQDNGWIQHIKVYDNGDREEWLEPDHQ